MDARRCPCGSLESLDACCGRYLGDDGAAPPTAEALMRSRYTAFVRGDVDHLLRTWHPDTRPAALEPDPGVRWTGLEVLDRVDGGLFDAEGVVEFRAHHRDGVQHERSRFVREAGRWLYVDGVVGTQG
ncbi:YchJ family metal-binding protein [Actinomycetospora sp. TBRC 11914]|uniref:YchJ family protein n=1 Tax=Actinomycetospora sp. TBRC 11914 TaxID=2729387 RepID=UPI00289FF89C|nr:YchJ family metal-binding protein [Actinomycetospora sp. TBRC 11914]